jgi:hypothetical protein
MSTAYYRFPENIPMDNQQCIIRVKYYYGSPFVAVYDSVMTSFSIPGTNLYYPFYVVSRWKPVI